MVMGVAVSNVVLTGRFTIPMIDSTFVPAGAAAVLFAVVGLRRPAPVARGVATNPEGGGP
jgi:hypothetical protein